MIYHLCVLSPILTCIWPVNCQQMAVINKPLRHGFPWQTETFWQGTFFSNEVFKNEFFQLRKMIGNPMAWLYFCYKTNRSYRKKFRNVITSIYRLNCMSAARTGVRFRYINFHHKSLPFPLHHINKYKLLQYAIIYLHIFIFLFSILSICSHNRKKRKWSIRHAFRAISTKYL